MATGQTKDAGWQVGVSRTVRVPIPEVWRYLTGPGLPVWLGVEELGAVGTLFSGDGLSGQVRSLTENVRVRVTRRLHTEEHETTIQIGLRPATNGTTIVFHQERMQDEQERQRAKLHWAAVADRVTKELSSN